MDDVRGLNPRYGPGNSSYDQCLHDTLRYSLSHDSIAEHPVDRSNRVSHVQDLDSLAAEIEALYIRSTNSASPSTPHACIPKPIIFDCSSRFQECGGLGDRLKGLASTFYLALLTNSRFYYHWTFPTDVGNYFMASNSSLSSPARTARSFMGIQYVTMFEWWCMNWHCMVRDIRRTREWNLPKLWHGYSSIISHTNMAYWDVLIQNPFLGATARRYNLHLLRQDEMFYIFTRLFFTKMTSFMGLALEPYRDLMSPSSDRVKVGVQLRIGNDTAWHEGPRHSLAAVGCFVEKAKLKCEEGNRQSKECLIFVSTDSQRALELFRARFKLLGISMMATDGPISHIDKPSQSLIRQHFVDPQSIITEHSRVFMDWILLTKMDYLYISRSGFSETAAFAGMVPTERLAVRDEYRCGFYPWTGEAGSKLW
ncbi:hypothetical protein AXG93_3661s1280 [Marchantia polymorpha subsp. ruderalis]|uniref:O-fucosyltransferase family protein n=1 Tax=Marchantia polymorpha subsp. ruderalis TaxID=1480154 RepID=A0A176VL27_MARPO|nr:hypothetical protein AXG93_3661s1280 [Marchantia polymorpha subsp. ruderalis]